MSSTSTNHIQFFPYVEILDELKEDSYKVTADK